MSEAREVMRWVKCEYARGNEMGEVRKLMRWVRCER